MRIPFTAAQQTMLPAEMRIRFQAICFEGATICLKGRFTVALLFPEVLL